MKDADAKAAANQHTITSDGAIRDEAPPMSQPQSEAEEMVQIQQHRVQNRRSGETIYYNIMYEHY